MGSSVNRDVTTNHHLLSHTSFKVSSIKGLHFRCNLTVTSDSSTSSIFATSNASAGFEFPQNSLIFVLAMLNGSEYPVGEQNQGMAEFDFVPEKKKTIEKKSQRIQNPSSGTKCSGLILQ